MPLTPLSLKGGTAVTAPFGKEGLGGFHVEASWRATILLEFAVLGHFREPGYSTLRERLKLVPQAGNGLLVRGCPSTGRMEIAPAPSAEKNRELVTVSGRSAV
jgi:hypothetical protein